MNRLLTGGQALVVVAIGFCVSASPVRAQTKKAEGLEQTYARLCGKGQKGETCAALRQAMLAKLSAEGAGANATDGNTARSPQAPLPGHESALAPSPAAAKPASAPYWGHYLDFVKEPRLSILAEGRLALAYEAPIATYAWEIPDEVMSVSVTQTDGSLKKVATFRWDEQRRALIQRQVHDSSESLLLPQSDGSFLQEGEKVRIIERKYNNGTIEQRTEVKGETGWELAYIYHHMLFSPASIDLLRQIHANASETARLASQIPRKYFDPAYQRELQEREDARRKANGGFFRSMLGAGLGVAAANAGGMDAAQTVGAAAKGAALMNPESQVAQAVGASGDAILHDSGLTTSAAAGTAGAAGRRSTSYPTRPNVLTGQAACAMMNEGNYRQVGVSGGNDVQLKTMCAQAFEYYTMYKRAIAQGYAEADANRTYSAHQQAAQNALAFYANNGAR